MKAMHVRWTAAVAVLCTSSLAYAYNPYVIPGFTTNPQPGSQLPGPAIVPGKEISFNSDQGFSALAAGFLTNDPEQVLAWDGTGGLAESYDYTGSIPGVTFERQVDALAANTDALFFEVIADTTHIVYSIDTVAALANPATPTPANLGARAQDIEFGMRGVQGGVHGKWAVHSVDINSDIGPNDDPEFDVDGVELWGGEPGTFPGSADSDKYSVANDAGNGASIFNYNRTTHTSTPFVSLFGVIGIEDAVTDLLGPLPDNIDHDEIDLDALMVMDLGTPDQFDRSETPDGFADLIIFSIRQLVDLNDPTGFYATGSELMVYDGNGTASWLLQGGHLWDKAWALDNMILPELRTGGWRQLDIDALEAASFPEPTSVALLALSGLAMLRRRK